MEENRIYYVYEHLRRDNGSCIYVGKGHNKRINCHSRNEKHDEIMKAVGIDVRIIMDGLTEDEAFSLENQTILHYVNTLGYGIDIDGYRNSESGYFLTNKTFGGKGFTGMKRKEHAERMSGKNNPMYGVNNWDNFTPERAAEVKQRISLTSKGENNPMYGVSPEDRMSAEKYESWLTKTVDRLKCQTGSSNPNAKPINVYSKDGSYLKTFPCIKDCAEWMMSTQEITCTMANLTSCIGSAARKSKAYKNLLFSFPSEN